MELCLAGAASAAWKLNKKIKITVFMKEAELGKLWAGKALRASLIIRLQSRGESFQARDHGLGTTLISKSFGHNLPVTKSRSPAESYAMPLRTAPELESSRFSIRPVRSIHPRTFPLR